MISLYDGNKYIVDGNKEIELGLLVYYYVTLLF